MGGMGGVGENRVGIKMHHERCLANKKNGALLICSTTTRRG